MDRKTVTYEVEEKKFKGYLVKNEIVNAPRPGIIVAHAWKGQDEFAREKADDLARLGYVAFAADVYGDGKEVETNDEAMALMSPLFLDRSLLRKRICAAYEAFKAESFVDGNQIGAIGFCFGGMTVIELLRSGVALKGVVSFHGVLGTALGDLKAAPVANAEKIQGSLLILHGHDDPMVSNEDLLNIQKEFTEAGVDWEIDIYGHTKHAFTNPDADDDTLGLKYNERADSRSWSAMKRFFGEKLT
ncbi:MAG: dienelactone hydrolase family protein [Chlamydiales bacterium]|nr:dienelactone hydrolase family protein [Chlamydiia bacterium]MCP5508104.1 dienelactone hydrolase family protein [Chlamydiales bacterium]